jgi:hypothetical protein
MLEQVGGMMGIGSEYHPQPGPGQSASAVLVRQGVSRKSRSNVEPDCGGSSKAFAQNYLYAIEKLSGVALGTDANGMVKGPGPRFGNEARLHGNYCPTERQQAPVRYASSVPGVKKWNGPNIPLHPLRTGLRTWDINTDGVAHYGMIPDFLQDLRNIGIEPQDLTPLFHGAENFARTWERTRRASLLVK